MSPVSDWLNESIGDVSTFPDSVFNVVYGTALSAADKQKAPGTGNIFPYPALCKRNLP